MKSEPCQPQMLQPQWSRRASAPTIGRSGECPPHGRSLGSRSERAATRSTVVILIPSASHLLRVQTDLPLRRMGRHCFAFVTPESTTSFGTAQRRQRRHSSCPPYPVAVEERVPRRTPEREVVGGGLASCLKPAANGASDRDECLAERGARIRPDLRIFMANAVHSRWCSDPLRPRGQAQIVGAEGFEPSLWTV
jgi:hypothetical protein